MIANISKHYAHARTRRESKISAIGEGSIIARFEIDRGHKNGAELHCITSTGIIIIYNLATMLLITKLIARPNQIKRYYPAGDWPADIVQIAIQRKS